MPYTNNMTERTPEEQHELLKLKYMALKERLTELVSTYEELDNDRRVTIHLLTNERDNLKKQVEEFETSIKASQESAKPVSD